MSRPARPPRHVRALLAGALLGVVGVWGALACGAPSDDERTERRAETTPEEIEQWRGELAKRGGPHMGFPDPPGVGPIERVFLGLGHESYALEIRVRPSTARLTLGIRGIDRQVGGGGWLAFAEGTWHAHERLATGAQAPNPWAGSVARISWSCLGAKLRSGNDGVGRLVFDAAGTGLKALYLGYGEPEVWTASYARVVPEGEGLARGSVVGQIPSTPRLAPLPPNGRFRVRVRVVAADGRALVGAVVRLKGFPATEHVTDPDGRAEVAFLGREAPRAQVLAAGALGYRNGERVVFADDAVPAWRDGATAGSELTIVLDPVPAGDDWRYVWQDARPDADPDSLMACGTCHKWHFDEWQGSRHARSADNGHVAHEHARFVASGAGPDDCRACHQPADAARNGETGWKPRGGSAAVHCDLCHKVAHVGDVRESGVWGAIGFSRPGPDERDRPGSIHRVFGPLPDVTYAFMGASWNPLYATSHYCAACHQGGGRWREGAPAKLDTFEEWRSWAVAVGRKDARSCQDCHMPGASTRADDGKVVDQIAWDALHRGPEQLHGHRFRGTEAEFAAAALKVDVEKKIVDGRLEARVRVTNVGAGHKIPTGTWTKHVLVGVWARQGGRWLLQVDGDRALTQHGAAPKEPLAAGDWRNPGGFVLGVREAGQAGAALAQPGLWDAWKPDDLVDERLLPGASREARVVFAAEGGEVPEVVVRIVHRRAELGRGPADTPWVPRPYDAPPETLWLEVVR